MTALCYFNALRELGGARRIVEDEVQDRASRYGTQRRRVEPMDAPFVDRAVREPLELTSRISTDQVAEAKQRLEAVFGGTGEPVDVALATNMISVGLDITRLGLMLVLGPTEDGSRIHPGNEPRRPPTHEAGSGPRRTQHAQAARPDAFRAIRSFPSYLLPRRRGDERHPMGRPCARPRARSGSGRRRPPSRPCANAGRGRNRPEGSSYPHCLSATPSSLAHPTVLSPVAKRHLPLSSTISLPLGSRRPKSRPRTAVNLSTLTSGAHTDSSICRSTRSWPILSKATGTSWPGDRCATSSPAFSSWFVIRTAGPSPTRMIFDGEERATPESARLNLWPGCDGRPTHPLGRDRWSRGVGAGRAVPPPSFRNRGSPSGSKRI